MCLAWLWDSLSGGGAGSAAILKENPSENDPDLKNRRFLKYKAPVYFEGLPYHLGLILSEAKFNNKMKLSSVTKLVMTRQTFNSNQFSTPPVTHLRGTLGTPDTHWSDITLEPKSLCSTSHVFGLALIFAFGRRSGLRSNSKGKSLRK